jgi:predicted O-methyltransferase YrrM
MIPKILHFCFGLSRQGGDWGLVHYACVKSAVERIRPEQAFLYFEYMPRGPFWDLTAKFVTCRKITAPREVFGNPLLHYAHRGDVLRLEKLIEMGGIYLDCDMFVHRDFDDLLENSVVIGQEGEQGKFGLCNAVILAEPDASFLKRWYAEYKTFRSKGHDPFWSEHSVEVPLKLAKIYGTELTILGPRAFFWPTWEEEGLKKIFASNEPIPREGVYANHLWESWAWPDYLRDLTPGRVRLVDSNFHCWMSPLIADLPDDLGVCSLAKRIINSSGNDDLLSKRWALRRNERRLRRKEKARRIVKRILPGRLRSRLKAALNDTVRRRIALTNALARAKAERIPFASGLGDSSNLLYGLVRSIKPSVCVEIGSARGRSTCYIGLALKENGRGTLFAIDPHIQTDWNDDNSIDTYAVLTENLAALGVGAHVQVLRSFSEEVAGSWNSPIDLLFIDGDHSYDGAKRDWELFSRHLSPFGVAIFHDTIWDLKPDSALSRLGKMGVPCFVNELREMGYPVLTIEKDCGVSLVQPVIGGVPLSRGDGNTHS